MGTYFKCVRLDVSNYISVSIDTQIITYLKGQKLII